MVFSKNDNFVKIIELQETKKTADSGERACPEPTWEPGWRRRFPWIGLGSLFFVLVSAALAAMVLILSDQRAQSSWPQKLTPSIILAGINAFSNLMLAVAIGQGVAIAWWRKALRGATVKELHRSWGFSTSIVEIVKGARYLNYIALASLAAKLTIVDSILLQGATSTFQANDAERSVSLSVPKMTTFPPTGVVTGDQTVWATTPDFQSNIVSQWRGASGTISQFSSFFPGCEGYCESTFEGLGFEYSCKINRLEANYDKLKNVTTALPVFRTSFDMSWASAFKTYTSIVFNGLYYQAASSEGSCEGYRITYRCDMRPALMDIDFTTYNYPGVDFSNNVALGFPEHNYSYYTGAWNMDGTQINGWRLKSYLDIDETGAEGTTKLGGIQLALNQYLGSSANITYQDGAGWTLSQDGWYASSQLGINSVSIESAGQSLTPGTCNYNYGDATVSIMNSINSLAFILNTFDLTSQEAGPTSTVNAVQTGYGIHYQTHYAYMYGAIASMVICVAFVLPTYYGFWQLKRKATLGPIELANAFHAPLPALTSNIPPQLTNAAGVLPSRVPGEGENPVPQPAAPTS